MQDRERNIGNDVCMYPYVCNYVHYILSDPAFGLVMFTSTTFKSGDLIPLQKLMIHIYYLRKIEEAS